MLNLPGTVGSQTIPIRILTPEMISEIYKDAGQNPTVSQMMFIQTRGNKLFPCYPALIIYGEDEKPNLIVMDIVQVVHGQYQMIEVRLKTDEFGIKWRTWNVAPAPMLMEDYPLAEAGEATEEAKDT